ncbi:hypothetical protein [Nonomuraea sediminis]|uniref:hypothetical protein n=1 Tax=Nonomuraea sediminis TaxID=2835864 RepID=UPI001BDDAEBA|nr:hypothetical protein [Nonomuraea sediminis]
MADLSLIQAWQMWLDNVQVSQDTLYGWSILALGRMGKVVAFLSGLTVVLDIIGPERLRRFGARTADSDPVISRWLWVLAVGVFVVSIPVFNLIPTLIEWGVLSDSRRLHDLMVALAVFFVIVMIVAGYSKVAIVGFAWVLARPMFERILRWLSVAGLIIGFHFDLLAS